MAHLSWISLLDQITDIVRQHGSLTASVAHKQAIVSLLENYTPDETDFQPYVHFDSNGYTKNLVRTINQHECNVIIMCWSGGQSSAFHGHEGSRCFVKVLSGQLMEQQVPYPNLCEDEKKTTRFQDFQFDKVLNSNDVTYIDDSIGLHKVTNKSSNQPAITLHVYMPAYRKCRIFETNGSGVKISNSQSIDVIFNSVDGKPSDQT